jgi:hypothetical protein
MPTRERRLAALARAAATADAQATPEDAELVPWYINAQAAAAIDEACRQLRQNPHLYRDVELALMHLQRGKYGPLTDLLQALVGKDEPEAHAN